MILFKAGVPGGREAVELVGSEQNLAVSVAQMQQALGRDTLAGLARQMGTGDGEKPPISFRNCCRG